MIDKNFPAPAKKTNVRLQVTDAIKECLVDDEGNGVFSLLDDANTPAFVEKDSTNPYAFVVSAGAKKFRVVVKEIE